MPVREALHEIYRDHYSVGPPPGVETRIAEIVHGFGPLRSTGRLLDVGFGAGLILDAARRAGWIVSGTELSSSAVAAAAARGLDVFHGSLADARFGDAAFDVVTVAEVLEHLIDPLSLLVEIRRVLRPGGLLWGTTPHASGLSARLLRTHWSVVAPQEHVQLFTTAGMRTLLHRAGFRDVRLHLQGVNPYEIIGHFRGGARMGGAERTRTSQQLNEYLSGSRSRNALKTAANTVLSLLRLGDSMKIRATA
jgi:SAM-dependent methyltransferase